MAIQKPEGTEDLLPADMRFYRTFVDTAFNVFGKYGYAPIETPLFEQTDLFVRGIGEATDVVSKEMFTAISAANMQKVLAGEKLRAKSRLSLRPEGTAGTVRAIAQAGLVGQGTAPVKFTYAGPMFRAERPQKGRLRQFHQVGVECMGADAPSIDAEGIIMLMRFYEEIGIPMDKTHLLINSMGDEHCRPEYREKVRTYILDHEDRMCDDCRRRADANPLRAFDCKEEGCRAVMADAPKVTDALCDECKSHYAQVKAYLDAAGIVYEEDPTLVRGLDYYTRTVFEIQVDIEGMGSNAAIGGGGRYDGLMKEISGKPAPGFGFAIGYERCRLALEAAGAATAVAPACDLFIACVDDSTRAAAFPLVQACRDAGASAEVDHQSRSLKSQFKLADKLGARKVAVLGPDEAAKGAVNLRDMATHEEEIVAWTDLPSRL
ncbi:histidine--tRNA ligase [Curtanaerobium respiraculi]|uniref:histidine--tRNA ligase n=1 Tax=Curtanaerobium respiraculi TaxID=2949669 RepID=UPI0024B38AD7|nr:histidine--tRNA ligase [Curtanaerobium respiraculi]